MMSCSPKKPYSHYDRQLHVEDRLNHPVSETVWQFPSSPLEVTFLKDGSVLFQNRKCDGQWGEIEEFFVFHCNGTLYELVVNGEEMAGEWYNLYRQETYRDYPEPTFLIKKPTGNATANQSTPQSQDETKKKYLFLKYPDALSEWQIHPSTSKYFTFQDGPGRGVVVFTLISRDKFFQPDTLINIESLEVDLVKILEVKKGVHMVVLELPVGEYYFIRPYLASTDEDDIDYGGLSPFRVYSGTITYVTPWDIRRKPRTESKEPHSGPDLDHRLLDLEFLYQKYPH